MGVDSKHPQWVLMAPTWVALRDAYAGEAAIKSKTAQYLPPTRGMVSDGLERPDQPGAKAYASYLTRAVFPDMFKPAVDALAGVIHRKAFTVKLPASLEGMRESCTVDGLSVDSLLRKVTAELMQVGRAALVTDVLTGPQARPVVAFYAAEALINWDVLDEPGQEKTLNFAVLDETGMVRDGFEWVERRRFRVMRVEGGAYLTTYGESGTEFAVAPSAAGRRLAEMPLVIANPVDLAPDVDRPPLDALARLCFSIYRGEADYREHLYLQGQDTLVVIGDDTVEDPESPAKVTRVGAGARLDLPMGGDAKYVGVSGQGLGEQRQALEADYARAGEMGARLLRVQGGGAESGESLRIRVAAQTASLTTIARASAAAVQEALRIAARWIGADDMQVVVEPNTDFTDAKMTGRDAMDWVSAKAAGAPLSLETIHEIFQQGEVTSLSYKDEIAKIEAEPMLMAGAPEPLDDEAEGPPDEEEDEEDAAA